jgi:glycosyltransferase involved in cell wall biosynthesis
MVPVLLGADVVCLPGAREGTGRLAAEALAFGRPIIIAQGAPGSSLVIPHPSGAPGLVVPSVEARTWSDAVTRITDQRWLDKASRAAREAGEELSLSNLLDRLEEQLQP